MFYHNPQEGAQQGILQIFSNDPDDYPYIINLSAYSFSPNYMIVQNAYSLPEDTIFVEIHVNNYNSFVALEFKLNFPNAVMTFIPE